MYVSGAQGSCSVCMKRLILPHLGQGGHPINTSIEWSVVYLPPVIVVDYLPLRATVVDLPLAFVYRAPADIPSLRFPVRTVLALGHLILFQFVLSLASETHALDQVDFADGALDNGAM